LPAALNDSKNFTLAVCVKVRRFFDSGSQVPTKFLPKIFDIRQAVTPHHHQSATMSIEQKKSSCRQVLIIIFVALLAIFIGLDQIKERFYIFDQNVLQQVAQRNIAKYENNTRLMMQGIADDLNKEYPGHVALKEEWVFNNAGGAMGSMWILHASITEYVIIFGTPVGTEGHTGRFMADDYFIILEGEQWAYAAGDVSREVSYAANCLFN
jgi:C-8 sterol isomerase